MTLSDIIKHQSIVDKRRPSFDTLEFLEKKKYSVSKDKFIKYGDMHIDHFIRTVDSDENNIEIKIYELLKTKYGKEETIC